LQLVTKIVSAAHLKKGCIQASPEHGGASPLLRVGSKDEQEDSLDVKGRAAKQHNLN
jgi:hypothetical protein